MISVIIPVYNTELYLDRCVESVLKSSYHDIEILLIDDGSDDSSPAICDRLAQTDKRIRVYHNENSGPSSARNFGIDHCCGEYVMFVDSDDYVDPFLCEKLINSLLDSNTDFAFCGHYSVASDENTIKLFSREGCTFFGSEYREKILLRTLGPSGEKEHDPRKLDILTPIWARIYKKQIIDDYRLRFIDLNRLPSECLQFNFEYCFHAASAAYVACPLYYYRRNTVSSVTKHYRSDLKEKWGWWNRYMEAYIKSNCDSAEFYKAFHGRICCAVIPLGGNAIRLNDFGRSLREMKAFLHEEMFTAAFNDFDTACWAFYWRIFFFAAKHKLVVSYYFMSLLMRKWLQFKHR